jgi:hypothetical protein
VPLLAGVAPRRAELRHVGRAVLARQAVVKRTHQIQRRPRLVRELLPHVRVVVADEVERLRDDVVEVLADHLRLV